MYFPPITQGICNPLLGTVQPGHGLDQPQEAVDGWILQGAGSYIHWYGNPEADIVSKLREMCRTKSVY